MGGVCVIWQWREIYAQCWLKYPDLCRVYEGPVNIKNNINMNLTDCESVDLKSSGIFVRHLVWVRQFHKFSKAKSPVCAILFTHSLVLSVSESLGLLNYKRPFFSVHCLLLPFFKLHLLQILSDIFQPSQSRSSNLLLPSSLFSNIFLTTFTWSILSKCPIHPNFLFFKISATMSRSLCSSFSSWLFLILHIPYLPLVHISFLVFSSPMYSFFSYSSLS